MPFCEDCDRYLTPTSMEADGTCPTCHRPVKIEGLAASEQDEPAATKIPWHFWVLLTAAVVYLGWRGIEGVVWLVNLVI
ncbi:MAG: hypothetical protein AAGA99_19155 [Actinomycetota bacterium]